MPVATTEVFPIGAVTIWHPTIPPVLAMQACQVTAVAATREAAAINDMLPQTRPTLHAGTKGF